MADDDRTNGDSLSADDDSGSEQPATPLRRNRGATPVRSAPLRRGRSAKPVRASGERAPEPEPAADTAVADTAEADTAGADPVDPADLEAALSYRERRRARAGTGAAVSRQVRTRPRLALTRWLAFWLLSAVLVVVLAVAGTVLGIGVYQADQQQRLRVEYADFARQLAINLTTFTPENVEETLASAREQVSGRAAEKLGETVGPTAAAVENSNFESRTTVISEAVTEATPTEGKVIMVFGTSMRDLAPEDPEVTPGQVVEVQTFRWWFQVTRINDELKLTDFEWVY